jgi:N-methylhydantoinase A
MRFATDTGGTFTDLVVEDDDGALSMYKAPTVPASPVEGVLGAFDVAAAERGTTRRALLARGRTFIHGTTHAINAIVTKRTARTALLVTHGHPDVLVLREGGRLGPFDHRVPYPDPYIPRALTFEVPERIMADGAVRTPLDEQAVVAIARDLKEQRVEAVAVCLLWSVVNPAHELRVAEILGAELPGLPVSLSHILNPSLREYRRAISTSIDASLKPLMTRYLGGLARAMRDNGFDGRILVLSSQGGMVEAAEVERAPILAINSGPSMAPIAGARIGESESETGDMIVFDTGGTTFDVSLVRAGRVPQTHETWLGRPFQSDLTGFPSVDVKSIGAGGGSIAWVDAGGVLHVGPQSAGAVPGPACYGAGGAEATMTDAALVAGYIDPDFFLGGSIRLDKALATEAIREKVAGPLGLSVEATAAAMLDVWTENMVQAIADITVNQGIDPAAAILIGGGGAAGLNAAAIANRLGCRSLVIPDVGAALSAAGAIASDIARDFRKVSVARTDGFGMDAARQVLAELRASADEFVATADVDAGAASVTYSVEARYPHQVWEIDVEVDPEDFSSPAGLKEVEKRFHRTHERIFAYCDPGSQVEIIAWRVAVRCAVGGQKGLLRLAASDDATVKQASRGVYFGATGWTEVPVRRFAGLPVGTLEPGPAIIESPFTSIVVDANSTYTRSRQGNLMVRARVAARPDTLDAVAGGNR